MLPWALLPGELLKLWENVGEDNHETSTSYWTLLFRALTIVNTVHVHARARGFILHTRACKPMLIPPVYLSFISRSLWIISAANIRTGFALALIVTVDSENKTRIVGQALLRNERTGSFAFVLHHYKKLRHGLSPEVSCVLLCRGGSFCIMQLFGQS